MRKRYFSSSFLVGAALLSPAAAQAAQPASQLPACLSALGPQGHEACRMRMSFFGTDAMGRVATAQQRHTGANDPVDGVLRGNAPYRSRYNYLHTGWSPVSLRAALPVGTTVRGGAMTYEVMLWAQLQVTPETPASYEAPMRVRLSLGDDQGRHLVTLREVEVPVSETVARPYTLETAGLNLGFEPAFLYVDLEQASPTPDRAAGAMIRVEGFHAAVRPTGR